MVILSRTFTYSPLFRIFAFLSLHFSLPSLFGRRSSHKFTFLLCFWLFLCCKILRSLYLFLPVTLREHIAPHSHCFPHCLNFFLFTWTPIASISVFYSEVFKLRHCDSAWTYCSALSQFSLILILLDLSFNLGRFSDLCTFLFPLRFGHRSYHKFPFLFSLRFWLQILS